MKICVDTGSEISKTLELTFGHPVFGYIPDLSLQLTGVPSAILEITNDNINQPAEFYARIANNQMKMAYKQGKYLNDFLMEALKGPNHLLL